MKFRSVLAVGFVALVAGAFASVVVASIDGRSDLQDQFVQPKTATAPEVRELSIDEAKRFDRFALYWLGEEFEGLPLDRIMRYYTPDAGLPEDAVVFIYGTCTPPADADYGCKPPLQVRVEPYCYKQPALIADEAKDGSEFSIRGADAQRISGALVLWTGEVAVKIASNDALEAKAADALVSPKETAGVISVAQPLPVPDKDCSDYLLQPYP